MGFYVGAECDKCGSKITWHGTETKKWMVWAIRRAGWTYGKYLLCENCKAVSRK